MTQRTLLRHVSGFSLVEMSVVLLVLGVLLASVLGPLRIQWQSERLRETRTRLDAAESALLGFVLQRGRLPCPADPTLVGSSAGLEDCGREQGTLPWQLLGIPEADAWGRRWLYAVSPGFADTSGNTPSPVAGCASPTPVPAIGISFTWCSAGVYTVSESGGGTSMVTNAVAVFGSHGADGLGGHTRDGTAMAAAAGEQAENADRDNDFVAGNEVDGNFDDQVRWLSTYRLHEWMLRSGRQP
ncbi:prepilin-type N-terminal cleavage/methylation domain-containing protein [Chitinolyticbacter meiyuanensis]|uniref:prepilin-type N-terminal cleavage/methylation domain-containing protein n=1 Tax=Chitinolyticbacter meiyuanensis TaxID=682798 RepID=UPI0011E60669|nr:prepilin-type N-terminal cleavage/methylation domain-containing protein [Chitinolyticbacter meiyuanensis]